jgi:hypothetical protein
MPLTAAILAAAGAMAIVTRTAPATVSYRYMTDTPAVTLAPLQTAGVNVFLEETVSGGSTSLLAAEHGIVGAGFQTTGFSNLAHPSSVQSITSNAAAFSGPASTGTTGANNLFLMEAVNFPDAIGALGSATGGITRVLLGTIHIQAGADAGRTMFSLAGYQDNTLTFTSGYDLDVSQGTAPAYTGTSFNVPPTPDFSVTVILPEPGSLALLGTGAIVLMRRRASR